MFLNAMTDLFYVGGRWWWAGAMGDVCPPPDIWQSLFVWNARYRKVARFFFGKLWKLWIFNRSRKEQA